VNATGASPADAARRKPWSRAPWLVIIIWQILADPDARFDDLGLLPDLGHFSVVDGGERFAEVVG
jgi:hypothetical protein